MDARRPLGPGPRRAPRYGLRLGRNRGWRTPTKIPPLAIRPPASRLSSRPNRGTLNRKSDAVSGIAHRTDGRPGNQRGAGRRPWEEKSMSAHKTHRPVLHHVNLKTRRLQAMIDWYGVVTGMTARYVFPGGAWLSNDAANHRLALLATPTLDDDPDKLAHTGLHHTA